MSENISISLKSILNHKLRSILTMLGIIVGIASIIAIFSIISGNTANMKKQMIGGETNSMRIEYGPRNSFISDGKQGDEKRPDYSPIITKGNLYQLLNIENAKRTSLFYESNLSVFHKENDADALVTGIDDNYFSILPYEVIEGTGFLSTDYQRQKQICLLSEAVSKKLFPFRSPVDQMIEINGIPFRVKGVVKSQTNERVDSNIFILANRQVLVEAKINSKPTILFQTVNSESLEKAVSEAATQLTKLVPPSDYIFSIKNYDDVKNMNDEINKSNVLLLGGIASISLIVGGIGVMNTMIVSVTERTREIGLKKALGAFRKTILQQFLTEAVVLSFIGGFLGIIIGITISFIITNFLNYPFKISLLSIFVSLLFSLVIGILFGILPAYKASKLHPIDALRYE